MTHPAPPSCRPGRGKDQDRMSASCSSDVATTLPAMVCATQPTCKCLPAGHVPVQACPHDLPRLWERGAAREDHAVARPCDVDQGQPTLATTGNVRAGHKAWSGLTHWSGRTGDEPTTSDRTPYGSGSTTQQGRSDTQHEQPPNRAGCEQSWACSSQESTRQSRGQRQDPRNGFSMATAAADCPASATHDASSS